VPVRKKQDTGYNTRQTYPKSQGIVMERTVPDTFKLLIFLLSAFLLYSCTKAPEEKASQAVGAIKTGIYKIELSPAYVTKDSSITVKVKNVNPPDVSYQWMVNGKEIEGATKNTLEYPDLKKNDKVQVKVSIKDVGELISEPLTVSNIIPKIQKAKVVSRNPKKGDELSVQTDTYDGDGDNVNLIYEWSLNSSLIGETASILKTSEMSVKRGDKISVKITPTDGQHEGESVTIYSIIANSLPKVLPNIKSEFKGAVYTSKIIAEDPEGDPLTYSLKQAPEGMTIDSQTGVITWTPEPKDAGEHEIIVSVSDGQGGEVIVSFTTTISFTSPE
jgi:hypothetical protein